MYTLGAETCKSNRIESIKATAPPGQPEVEIPSSGQSYFEGLSNHFRSENDLRTEDNSSCGDADEQEDPYYCNGPLKKNIEYVVRLRVFTSAGYSDSEEIFFVTGQC